MASSLINLTVSPTSLTGGQSATGTVTLNAAAPMGGLVVALQSASPSVHVPTSVTIPAGRSSATFRITTDVSAANLAAIISATLPKTATLTVKAAAAPPANRPPTATAGGPYSGTAGQPIAFSGSGSDPDGNALSFAWSFSDGGSAAGASVSHTFAAAGVYTALLTVSDGKGGTATATASVSVAAVVTPPDPPPTPPPAPPPSGSKARLTAADLTFLGNFELPASVAGLDQSFCYGLALRYLNGQPRLIACAQTGGGVVFECNIPTVSVGSRAIASVLKNWGDVFGSKRKTAVRDGNTSITGLFWDEPDKRLYWSYYNSYNAEAADDAVFGCSRCDDMAGVATPLHYYRMQTGGCKAANFGLTAIPAWFSDLYCPGKRLGVGFGGYQSILSVGGVSMGPALSAIAPPTGNEADGAALANLPLVGYPFTETIYGPPDRCHRDTGFDQQFDGWKTRNGVAYWSWCDWASQFGVWIDTPTKSAFLAAPILGVGKCWYNTTDPHAMTIAGSGAAHWWYFYDPADLAAVASGAKKSWEIQPTEEHAVSYPGVSGQGTWYDLPDHMITGIVFDPVASRLYVAVGFGSYPSLQGAQYGSTLVEVYQVG